jgi:hypothetical protein
LAKRAAFVDEMTFWECAARGNRCIARESFFAVFFTSPATERHGPVTSVARA